MAICGKKVELSELSNLCKTFLKKTEIQFYNKMKMNITSFKYELCENFDMKNDLTNTNDEYNFINSCKNISKRRKVLLKAFISNEYIKEFFSKGRNEKMIL